MSWKTDNTQPIDEDLLENVKDKIDDGEFGKEDLKDFFTLFAQIANNTEDIQDEAEGFDRKFQFKFTDHENAWLIIKDRKFVMGNGNIDAPDNTLEMTITTAVGIFSGDVDATAAYMNGDIKVSGVINDVIQFRSILEMVQEELE